MGKNEKTKIKFLNNCLLIDNQVLVFGDFHLGYEDSVIREGMLPNIQFQGTMKDLDGVFRDLFLNAVVVRKIILLGDLKHDFGKVSEAEWRESHKLLDYFIKKVGNKNIVLIKGNHDNFLIGVAKKKKINLEKYWRYKEVVFMHGHELYEKALKDEESRILILGHLHPAITLQEDYKREKYKCFLRGRWKKRRFIVLPSFSGFSLGYDVRRIKNTFGKKESGFLFIDDKYLLNSEVIIYDSKDKKEYNFGKLKKLI